MSTNDNGQKGNATDRHKSQFKSRMEVAKEESSSHSSFDSASSSENGKNAPYTKSSTRKTDIQVTNLDPTMRDVLTKPNEVKS